MGDHEVILNDLRSRADKLERRADSYGEDMGAPYREAAEAVREVADTYDASLPDPADE